MHLAATIICCTLLASLAAGSALAQGISAFEYPAPLNSNAAVDDSEDQVPRTASDGLGNWVTVWRSKDSLGGSIGNDSDILFARSIDGGGTWTDAAPLNTNAGSDSEGDFLPQVATDGLGIWVAVWDSKDTLGGTLGNDRDVLVARSTDSGATWSDPVPLHGNASSDTGQDSNPQIATDGLGSWVAVWVSTNSFGDTLAMDEDLVFARSTDGGVTWSAPEALNSNADRNTRTDDEPRLATNGQGTWVTVWQSKEGSGGLDNDYDILFARSEDAGVSWSDSLPVNSNADNDGGADWTPVVAGDAAGLWISVWVRRNTNPDPNRVDTDLWFSRSEDDGRTWSGRKRLRRNTRKNEWWPEIETDRQGTWAVVWYSKHKSDDDIFITRSATGGESWTDPEFLNTNAKKDKGNDRFPFLSTYGNGNWLAVWDSKDKLDDTIGKDWDVLFARNLLSQSDDQQKCTNDQNKAAAKLTRAQEKQTLRCLEEVSVEACLDANRPDSKTVTSCGKLDEGGFGTTPSFGVAPAAMVRGAALDAPVLLAEDLLGPDLDNALPGDDPAGSKCQHSALKQSYRVYDVLWKELLKGKRSVLAGKGSDGNRVAPPESADDLSTDLAAWVEADPRGKIAKAVASLPRTIGKACENPKKPPLTSLDTLFPGLCSSAAVSGADSLASCTSERIHCRFCQQLNRSDALTIDCDAFDDDATNGSCSLLP
jgi:hypothetical protein